MRAVCDQVAEKFHAGKMQKMQKNLKCGKLGLLMGASCVCVTKRW